MVAGGVRPRRKVEHLENVMVTSHQLKTARDLVRFAGIGYVLCEERSNQVSEVLAAADNPEIGDLGLSNARDVAKALSMGLAPTAEKCGRAGSELTRALEVLRSVERQTEADGEAGMPRMRHH